MLAPGKSRVRYIFWVTDIIHHSCKVVPICRSQPSQLRCWNDEYLISGNQDRSLDDIKGGFQ